MRYMAGHISRICRWKMLIITACFIIITLGFINIINGRSISNIEEGLNLSIRLFDNDMPSTTRCRPFSQLKISIHNSSHPLAQAFSQHPSVVTSIDVPCVVISVVNGSKDEIPHQVPEGSYHLIINTDDNISLQGTGNEIIVQSNFGESRGRLDISVSPEVSLFDINRWKSLPYIHPLKRKNLAVILTSKSIESIDGLVSIKCEGTCASLLLDYIFCVIPSSPLFHRHLLSSLRGGCIPIVLSDTQLLPFQDELDWRLASLRFAESTLSEVPEIIKGIAIEDMLEMKRRGRVFLERIDDATALSKSILASIAVKLHLRLPLAPYGVTKPLFGDSYESPFNSEYIKVPALQNYTRIASSFNHHSITANGMYSYVRWNSGRDLTFTPRTLHDVYDLPAESEHYAGTNELLDDLYAFDNGNAHMEHLGLNRAKEQFTVVILTYKRDEALAEKIQILDNCLHLNKIIVVWNDINRTAPKAWPRIHVPVQFVLAERNSLNNRYIPYDLIETEAVLLFDDDVYFTQPEILFLFRAWRENRDRVVGFSTRYHSWNNDQASYGYNSKLCQYSIVLSAFAIVHKEFLYEYTYNQHPAILQHVNHSNNCDDIAMIYFMSHLTRKAPLKTVKKSTSMSNKTEIGLSGNGDHFFERDECVRLFNRIYGYNPLKFTQLQAVPTHKRCVKGLVL